MTEATSMDQLHAETTTLPKDYIEAPLGPEGEILRIKPRRLWRSSSLDALTAGNFGVWAQACLADGDSIDAWFDIDPTVEEITEFFEHIEKVEGSNPLRRRRSRR